MWRGGEEWKMYNHRQKNRRGGVIGGKKKIRLKTRLKWAEKGEYSWEKES